MKKQIFILMVFILAVFASINESYGQKLSTAPVGFPTVVDVTCGSTAGVAPELEPIAGQAYDYTVTVTPGTGTYHWFVTNATTFIDATGLITTGADPGDGSGNYILAVGTIANYNKTDGTSNTIKITWKSFTTDPVFLVMYSDNSAASCADNMQAWRILPRNGFTLDLANINDDGTSESVDFATCVPAVASAIYNSTDKAIDMLYGINYLYYAVSAANYGDAWKPSVELTLPTDFIGSTNNDRTVTVEWAYKADATDITDWHSMPLASGVYTSTDYAKNNAYAVSKEATATDNGNEIVIRVTIDHKNQESLVDADITLAIDGEMFGDNGTSLVSQGYDVATASWTDFTAPYTGECGTIDGFENDHINQVLTARPTIVGSNPDSTSDGLFVPKQ